jgi:hypothetical protein
MPHRAWKAMFRGFVAKHWQNNGIGVTDEVDVAVLTPLLDEGLYGGRAGRRGVQALTAFVKSMLGCMICQEEIHYRIMR